jgi:hypothetical protein
MLLKDAYPDNITPRPGQSILYAAIVADTLKQAAQIEREVTNWPTVASVDGSDRGNAIFQLLTEDQTPEIKLVRQIKKEVSGLKFASADTNEVAMHDLSLTLWITMSYLSWAADGVGTERPQLAAELRALAQSIRDFRVKMLSADPAIPDRLKDYQEALFDDIGQTFESIQTQDTGSQLRPQDLPPALRTRFVGRTGKYMVQVFPRDDVWKHENQQKFITELRTAMRDQADKVTGTPVQLYEYTKLLKDSYQQAAL